MTVCPDGYVQGGVTLASNATLSNAASGAATVYGDVTATGPGAKISGGFKFEGGAIAFRNADPRAPDLSSVLKFENAAEKFLENVGSVTVDFAAKPVRGRIIVSQAGGLAPETVAEKVSVTVDGEPYRPAKARIEDGNLVLRNCAGLLLLLR